MVRVYLLGRSISLLDVSIDKGGQVEGGRVDVSLFLGDTQFLEQLLDDLDGAFVLRHVGGRATDGQNFLSVWFWRGCKLFLCADERAWPVGCSLKRGMRRECTRRRCSEGLESALK